jgi:hypothetical protein
MQTALYPEIRVTRGFMHNLGWYAPPQVLSRVVPLAFFAACQTKDFLLQPMRDLPGQRQLFEFRSHNTAALAPQELYPALLQQQQQQQQETEGEQEELLEQQHHQQQLEQPGQLLPQPSHQHVHLPQQQQAMPPPPPVLQQHQPPQQQQRGMPPKPLHQQEQRQQLGMPPLPEQQQQQGMPSIPQQQHLPPPPPIPQQQQQLGMLPLPQQQHLLPQQQQQGVLPTLQPQQQQQQQRSQDTSLEAAQATAASLRANCDMLKGPPRSTADDPQGFVGSFFK